MNGQVRIRMAVVLAVTMAAVALATSCATRHCTQTSDCGGDDVCMFDPNAGCSAQGVCGATAAEQCLRPAVAYCGCGGEAVTVAGCETSASVPIRNRGGCALEGERCETVRCAEGLACAYRISDGCNAEGTCMHSDDHCTGQSVPVGCTCTGGALFSRECNLPPEFASAPLYTTPDCDDGGFTPDSGADAMLE